MENIEKWLRRRSTYDERALRALSGKVVRHGSTSGSQDRAAQYRSKGFRGGVALGELHPTAEMAGTFEE